MIVNIKDMSYQLKQLPIYKNLIKRHIFKAVNKKIEKIWKEYTKIDKDN